MFNIFKYQLFSWRIIFLIFSILPSTSFSQPKIQGDDDLSVFPFLISYDGPVNATSMAHLLDAPAGKHGFVTVKNGRFFNNNGPVRFFGTNLTGSANFPSHKDADQLAERLARFGINCVRLHYMDAAYGNFMSEKEPGIIENSPSTQRNFSTSQIEKLDYLIATLKKRGIYVNVNLHVGRTWDKRDGFPVKTIPAADSGLDNFYPAMIELQKEYAKKLLTHVNPHTGLALSDDPCVAMVEINNENGLLYVYKNGRLDHLPDEYTCELQRQWNEWLQKKYKSTKELLKAWNCNLENFSTEEQNPGNNHRDKLSIENKTVSCVKTTSDAPLQVRKDFYQFIIDTEGGYWLEMYNYLKKDLKVKSVISGTQPFFSSVYNQAKLDYIDSHAYWCHPHPVGPDWKIKNEPMVNSMSEIRKLAAQRVYNKPYTVSEYNHPFPNQYGAEGQAMLSAYGRLQGWDGVFEYTYNHRLNFEPDHNEYFFSIIARTDVLAHFPACAAMFLRGDVRESADYKIGKISYQKYFDRLVESEILSADIGFAGIDSKETLIQKTAIDLKGKAKHQPDGVKKVPNSSKIYAADTGELTWNTEQSDSAYWTVNTQNTKFFTGFPNNRIISMGTIELEIGNTRLGWATISLVSRDATGFGESDKPANILLAATGFSENKDMCITQLAGNEITLKDWGKGPVYVEGITASLTLPSNYKRTKCYALAPNGSRKMEVPVIGGDGGKTTIKIGPEYRTIWYEIEIDRVY